MAKSAAERSREYRERKRAPEDWQVKALKEEVRVLGDLVGALEARIERLERPTVVPTPNNVLAQLRAQINAVPQVRPERIPDPFGPGRAMPNMPVQPYGEWEPS